MPTITLPANRRDQELILAYLTENASEVLTDKINNGVLFVKDGKQLINRKGLNGFMKYATDEARKLAEKGANSACVEDSVVCGRAMHYFKEDSIEGKLYKQVLIDSFVNAICTTITPSSLVTTRTAKKRSHLKILRTLNSARLSKNKKINPNKSVRIYSRLVNRLRALSNLIIDARF